MYRKMPFLPMDNAALKASSGLLSRSPSTDTERLGLLYGLVPRSVAISIAISGLTVLALWDQADHAALLAWLAAATLVSSARGALYVFFRRAATAASKTAFWENLFTAGAGLMGIVWAALVLIGPVSMAYNIFMVFVVGGMAMGAAGILGASQKAFLCFVIPMLVAQIGELFWIGGNVFALMGAIFSFGLFSAYSEFRRALLLALDARMNIEQLHREQRLIFDTATVGILFIRDRKIVDCNQRMADIVGFVRDELIGSSTRTFYPSDQNWKDFGNRAYAALGEGKTFRDELVLRKKTGDLITCDVSLNSLVPSRPEQGIITTANDISARKRAEHDLRKALQEQYAIFDNAVVGIAYLHGTKIENCNSRFGKIFGYRREEMIGGSTRVFHLSQESWEQRAKSTYEAISKGDAHVFDDEFVKKDGSRFWCRVYCRAIDPVHPESAVFVFTDITEQKRAEQELLASRDRLDLVIKASQGGIWDWDIASNATFYSARFKEILGYPADADFSTLFHLLDRLHPEERERMLAAQELHLRKREPFDHEYRMRRADGSYVWVQGRGQAVWDESGQPVRFVGSIIDITEHKQQEEQIHRLAQHDPLTGLPNRRMLGDRLHQALGHARRNKDKLAVMLLDLDGFKMINDTFGHKTGDAVLIDVAHRLRACIRSTDTVARYGGDEFVFVLEGQHTREDSAKLAEKILKMLHQPVVIADGRFSVGASIGIAIYPTDADDAEGLLKMADNAMYRAKQAGHNSYLFCTAESSSV